MSLVILTADGIQHRYVTNSITSALGSQVTAIILADPPHNNVLENAQRIRKKYSVGQVISRVGARSYRIATRADARRATTYRRLLFPHGDPGVFDRPDLVRTVPFHNGQASLGLLANLKPTVIAVYGTQIIRTPVIEMATTGIFNMHTGISPRYRGSDTIFWALHNAEPEWVGVTIHELDEGTDSGPIIDIGRPDIEPDDDEDSLFAKCVVLGAGLYVEALRNALEGTSSGRPQSLEDGHNYLSVLRTIRAELRVRRLLKSGLLGPGASPASGGE